MYTTVWTIDIKTACFICEEGDSYLLGFRITCPCFLPSPRDQVFDILPLHGLLLPGQSQQVQFTFYGHAGITTEVTAVCRVEGGPAYQLRLSGEASGMEYRFSSRHIDLGKKVCSIKLGINILIRVQPQRRTICKGKRGYSDGILTPGVNSDNGV